MRFFKTSCKSGVTIFGDEMARTSHIFAVICLVISSFWAQTALAAQSTPHVGFPLTARLISAENGIAPGKGQISAGLYIDLKDKWHTYWRSPGEVGLPPRIDWSASQNIKSVDFEYPAPLRFTAFGIENFGYKEEVLFPLRVTLETPGQPAVLTADVNLLVCDDICVPEQFQLSLDLGRSVTIDDRSAAKIASYIDQIPDNETAPLAVYFNQNKTTLDVTFPVSMGMDGIDVFPEYGFSAFGKPVIQTLDDATGIARFPILALDPQDYPLSVTIKRPTGAQTHVTDLSETPLAPSGNLIPSNQSAQSILWVIFIAFLGGVILNVMPCVLPVLSIKMAGVIGASNLSEGQIRKGFFATTLGIVSFMWILAIFVISLQSMGQVVGWGLHFQNPIFLILIIAVLLLFSANLFGAFEFSLPQSWNSKMADSSAKSHLIGDYLTGVFAAILATPCSAPLLGTAVAFALSSGPLEIVVIFTALGAGLALPYILFAIWPNAIQSLPKPGPWMVKIKIVLGLAMVATAIWLASILFSISGQTATIIAVGFTLAAALVFWTRLEFPQTAKIATFTVLTAFAVATVLYLDQEPQNRDLVLDDNINWQAFERTEIAKAVSRGEVVFVDVTAQWCLTCKANKRLVLNRASVLKALETTTNLQADWTRPDDSISAFLNANGRFGIPFNIVYGPAEPNGIPLPELLTKEAILKAIEQARG